MKKKASKSERKIKFLWTPNLIVYRETVFNLHKANKINCLMLGKLLNIKSVYKIHFYFSKIVIKNKNAFQ